MKSKSKRVTTIYIDNDLYRQVRILAAHMDKKINDCFIEALIEYMKRNSKYLKR